MGHVSRAAAILRRMRRHDMLVVTNAENLLPLEQNGLPYIHITERHPDRFRECVHELLPAHAPQVLVVDALPHGVVGELTELLPELMCRKALVYRHLRDRFREELHSTAFDHFLCVEGLPIESAQPQMICEPVLIRDADELLPRAAARLAFDVHDDAPVVVGVACGDAQRDAALFGLLQKIWRRRMPEAHLRLASMNPGDGVLCLYPLLEWFNGIDLLVGGGGYNLFHEARVCGLPAIFLPRDRRYDDQHWRVRESKTVDSPERLESALLATLPRLTPRKPAAYENGAVRAAECISRLLTGGSCQAARLPSR